jgi:IS5 family transposase
MPCQTVQSPPSTAAHLRTRLGRLIRDIRRKIAGNADLEAVFAWPLSRADQIRSQQQRQRGWKLYSSHAPEVECIGRGKASAPYEFRCESFRRHH